MKLAFRSTRLTVGAPLFTRPISVSENGLRTAVERRQRFSVRR